jgi:hypothetical protein
VYNALGNRYQSAIGNLITSYSLVLTANLPEVLR